ncbi:hypothetical protein AAMO2058_000392700 [Amorphochlora amoebiformis]
MDPWVEIEANVTKRASLTMCMHLGASHALSRFRYILLKAETGRWVVVTRRWEREGSMVRICQNTWTALGLDSPPDSTPRARSDKKARESVGPIENETASLRARGVPAGEIFGSPRRVWIRCGSRLLSGSRGVRRRGGKFLENSPVGVGSWVGIDWFNNPKETAQIVHVDVKLPKNEDPQHEAGIGVGQGGDKDGNGVGQPGDRGSDGGFGRIYVLGGNTRVEFIGECYRNMTESDRRVWVKAASALCPGQERAIDRITTNIARTLRNSPEISGTRTPGENSEVIREVSKNLQEISQISKENSGDFRGDSKNLRKSSRNLPKKRVASRCFLLHGIPGTGKTKVAMAIGKTSGLGVYRIGAGDLFRKEAGESERELWKVFKAAESNSPSMVIIDEIDALTPRSGGNSEPSSICCRITRLLCKLLDTINSPKIGLLLYISAYLICSKPIFVIATTSRVDSIDKRICRSGRLDCWIHMTAPSEAGREQILQSMLSKIDFDGKTVGMDRKERKEMIHYIAKKTSGYVPADLLRLSQELIILAHRRITSSKIEEEASHRANIRVTIKDINTVLSVVKPTRTSRFTLNIKTPNVGQSLLESLAGLDKTIERLRVLIQKPFQNPEVFLALGVKPPKGVVIYGPPGVGKTVLATALAKESGLNVISLYGPSVISKVVGESSKAISSVFRLARDTAPCIILIDQIETIANRRASHSQGSGEQAHSFDRVLSTLLTEMDGVDILSQSSSKEGDGKFSDSIIILATTSHPHHLDPAILRPGRLDQHIFIPAPSSSQRVSILSKKCSQMKLSRDCKDRIPIIGAQLEGFSGADIANLCQEAALAALREDIEAEEVRLKHFQKALDCCRGSLVGWVARHPGGT